MDDKTNSFELDITKGKILTKVGKQTNAIFPLLIFLAIVFAIYGLIKIFAVIDIFTNTMFVIIILIFTGVFLYFAIKKPDYLQSEEYRYAVKHLELSRESKYKELLNDENDILENANNDSPLLSCVEISEPDKEENIDGKI